MEELLSLMSSQSELCGQGCMSVRLHRIIRGMRSTSPLEVNRAKSKIVVPEAAIGGLPLRRMRTTA